MILNPHKIKNNVNYLTLEDDQFNSKYLNVRHKEQRVLSDVEVSLLPKKIKINSNEWLLREKSAIRFINYIESKQNISILDVGCGNGWFTNLIALNNNVVRGIDINIYELEQACRVFKKDNLQFIYGDIFKIDKPFRQAFDIIVLNASVQYFENFEILISTLKTFLKPNGEIHIIDSPFYSNNKRLEAKKRTEDYYNELGFPEMSKYYFHHLLEDLELFEILYKPNRSLANKIFRSSDSPFIWSRLKSYNSNISKGFSKIAHQYEQLDKTSSLVNWMRIKARNHLSKTLTLESSILEINCGSGIDAVHFAKKAQIVHATDISSGMIDYVKSKIISENLETRLSCQILTYTELNKLKGNRYTHIFSNFGGLNCCSLKSLKQVFDSFNNILESNGIIVLVLMPKISIWEFMKIFKGNKNAFRRLKKNGVIANIKGEKILTYYHSSKKIKNLLEEANFSNFEIENICFIGPNGNRPNFPENHPILFNLLKKINTISNYFSFLKGCGDYYIISARKNKII